VSSGLGERKVYRLAVNKVIDEHIVFAFLGHLRGHIFINHSIYARFNVREHLCSIIYITLENKIIFK
jgi:hypothetical protein